MCPIYVFHGDDDFSIAEALAELKQALGPAELRDVNLATFSAGAASYEEVIAASSTVPFMTPARMVVVEGLLATFEGAGPRRAGRSRAGASKESAGPWAQLPDAAAGLPPTTILVFRDGPLRDGNPLLQLLKPVATVRRFSPLQREDLRLWVGERMARKGGSMSDKSTRLLTELVGGNLWALDAELEKLQLYAGERPVSEDDVRLLVSRAREANIFAAVDAMVEGRQAAALRELQRLLADGAAAPYILTMIVRQVRLVLLALSLKGQRMGEQELSKRLGVSSPYVLRKVQEQSQRFTTPKLTALYRQLLDADTAIKTGAGAPESVLELLVTDVSRAGR